MNYRKVYMAIIAHTMKEHRVKRSKDAENYVYYEAHHILPKSLFPAWKSRKSNIVLLTAREHYFCHQLLTKIYPSKQMIFALWRLTTDKRDGRKISMREYEVLKEKISKIISKNFSGKGNPMAGKSVIKNMSDIELEKYKKKMSIACKNIVRTESWNKNISKALKGKPKSESHKVKMRLVLEKYREQNIKKACEFHKNKHWYNNGDKNIFDYICPSGYVAGKLHKPYKTRQGSLKNQG